MNSPYRVARERMGWVWLFMSPPNKLYAMYLCAMEMLWAAIGRLSRRMGGTPNA